MVDLPQFLLPRCLSDAVLKFTSLLLSMYQEESYEACILCAQDAGFWVTVSVELPNASSAGGGRDLPAFPLAGRDSQSEPAEWAYCCTINLSPSSHV